MNTTTHTNGHSSGPEALRIKCLTLSDIGCFENYNLYPDHFTLLEGQNGEGKTTIAHALEALVEGGNPVEIIRNGSDTGTIAIEFTNGIQFKKTLSRTGRATLKETHPEFGNVSAAQTHLDKLMADTLAVNPARLMDGKPAERVNYMLSRLPIEVPREKLEAILPAGTIIPDGHALKVLPELRKGLEERRKMKRQQKEDKEGSINEFEKSLPSETGEDVRELLDIARANLDSAKEALISETSKKADEYASLDFGRERELEKFKHDGELQLERDIQKLRDEWTNKLRTKEIESEADAKSYEAQKTEAINSITTLYSETIENAMKEVGRLEQALEESVRTTHTRELLTKARAEHDRLASEWKNLDAQIKSLDELSDSLTAELPITGLTIGTDGDLAYNGVTWTQINRAKRMEICWQLGELTPGPFVFWDEIEHLDPINLELFIKRGLASPKQSICTRVTAGSLRVEKFAKEVECA